MSAFHTAMSIHIGNTPVVAKVVKFSYFANLDLEVDNTTVRLFLSDVADAVKIAEAILAAAADPVAARHEALASA